ncbi:DEAD/DEAH box helicase [Candidatus Phytoplasma oryzae]|nr:DEAD/DEAH box helicase family protein [Candidatus Phytoplasma oryzae]
MILRKRQKELVDKIVKVLEKRNNAFVIAPTGSGKTIMFSHILKELLEKKIIKKACILVDKNLINEQNKAKFEKINPYITTCLFNSQIKKWDAQVIFAMIQTLNKKDNLENINNMDMLVIDEAHHATQNNTYKNVIDYFNKINPNCKFLGMTATARRGDRKNLNNVFQQIDDQIKIKELIDAGYLVSPKLYTPDIGISNQINKITKSDKNLNYNMDQIEKIMNTEPTNEAVFKHWYDKAKNRQTVIFCSNLKHAEGVTKFFKNKNINAEMISSKLDDKSRDKILDDFQEQKIQIVINVAVLIEGWDCPIVSCILLLRPSSCKATLEQMIGRGLRILEHHKIIKKDCIVIDFGKSVEKHFNKLFKSINKLNLNKRKNIKNNFYNYDNYEETFSLTKNKKMIMKINNFTLKEVELSFFTNSNQFDDIHFKWIKLNDRKRCFIANGFESFSFIIKKKDIWYVIGGLKKKSKENNNFTKILMRGTKKNCFAYANDWLNKNETNESAHKIRPWLNQLITDNQMKLIYDLLKIIDKEKFRFDFSKNNIKKLNKYTASVLIICMKKHKEIKKIYKQIKD